jgi:biotin--protein ligase
VRSALPSWHHKLILIRFASVNLDRNSGGPGYSKVVDAVAEDDESRTSFLKACLSKLGLTVSQETISVPSLSRLHISSMNHIEVSELLEELKDVITVEDGEEYIKGENDTFHIEKHSTRWSFNSIVKSLPLMVSETGAIQSKTGMTDDATEDRILDYNTIVKRIIPHETGWPGGKETPYFNHNAFFANLRRYQQEESIEAEEFGNILMYGEVVTSTNTILEKYIDLSFCETQLTSHPEIPNFSLTYQMASRPLQRFR